MPLWHHFDRQVDEPNRRTGIMLAFAQFVQDALNAKCMVPRYFVEPDEPRFRIWCSRKGFIKLEIEEVKGGNFAYRLVTEGENELPFKEREELKAKTFRPFDPGDFVNFVMETFKAK